MDKTSPPAFSRAELFALVASLLLLLGKALILAQPAQPSWAVWLLLWSPGVLMLLGEPMASLGQPKVALKPFHYVVMLVCLWTAMRWPPGPAAAALAAGWLLLRSFVGAGVIFRWLHQPPSTAKDLCLDAARLFPVIGAAWLLANRLNWMPFGFDALIVLLTAAHFHHAGFSLPLIAGLGAQHQVSRFSVVSCRLILIGVPLVAAGITCTHFQVMPWVEPVSVAVLVTGALGVAYGQMRLAFTAAASIGVRVLFFISGLSLAVAMILALGYGLRSILPMPSLSLPFMWAFHGGLNTFGFGLCGILAWRLWKPLPVLSPS